MNRRSFVSTGLAAMAAAGPPSQEITLLEATPGIRFGLRGRKPGVPVPTVFLFSTTLWESFQNQSYRVGRVGAILSGHGFLPVSLDLPCHGQDEKASQGEGLDCWRVRLEHGDNFLPGFLAGLSSVLGFLVDQGYTDGRRVAACGMSRGGFIALHFGAADPRVKAIAAFAPVTDLLALREFGEIKRREPAASLSLLHKVEQLAGRAVWLCIGNNDVRVGTRNVVVLTQRILDAAAAQNRAAKAALLVAPAEGHSVPPEAAEQAAQWIVAQMDVR